MTLHLPDHGLGGRMVKITDAIFEDSLSRRSRAHIALVLFKMMTWQRDLLTVGWFLMILLGSEIGRIGVGDFKRSSEDDNGRIIRYRFKSDRINDDM